MIFSNMTDLAARCELDFSRSNDRYCHMIVLRQGETATSILESVEGTAEEAWPPSPPLQQMHEQELNGSPVVWGLGMAGAGHWSASFSVDESSNESLRVELALRSSVNPKSFGSKYHLLLDEAWVNNDVPGSLTISFGLAAIELRVDENLCHFGWDAKCREITIVPVNRWNARKTTVSWEYTLRYCPSPL